MGTEQRIIDMAIELFNDEGTGAVSTNHIARALGISPGNLYYHFRNKEEIIRAIYAQVRPAWEEAAAVPADRAPTVADAERILASYFGLVWDYRFYYRELPALLRRDPELAKEYRDVRRAGLANIEGLLAAFVAAGVMHAPPDRGALADLAQVCWILVDFWLPFAELSDEDQSQLLDRDAIIERGVAAVFGVLRPYVIDAALASDGPRAMGGRTDLGANS